MKTQIAAGGLLLLFVLASGCAFMAGAAVAGAAAYVWKEGELSRTYNQPFAETRTAVIAALREDMRYTIVEKDGDTVKGKAPDGTDVNVQLKYINRKATEVRIRVGIIGDEALSQRIMGEIDARLE